MHRQTSPLARLDLDGLTDLGTLVVDHRQAQRSAAKKNRRNRHVEKQLLRHAVVQRSRAAREDDPLAQDDAAPEA